MAHKKRVTTNLSKRHYNLLKKLAENTSRGMSEIVREATLRYLGECSYLTEDEKKGLRL